MPVHVVADTIPAPTAIVPESQMGGFLVVNSGTQGPQGPSGPSSSGNVFIQDTPPVSPPAQYLWIQSNYPTAGNMTWWVGF